MQRTLCRLVYFVVVALVIDAAAVRADIDATGTWYVQVVDFGITLTEQWVQTGSTLVIDGAAGTINPQTGDFVVLFPPDPTNPCLQPHSGSLSGTVAPDGQTLTGELGVCGSTPTTCCALGGGISFPVVGSRNPPVCGDGIIEPPETCDDGNTAAGDGCDATCHVESCRVCSGAPSVCTLAPDGSPCDDGNPCTANACDASGTCLVTNPAALDCDDGHACTVDTCDPLVGCVHTAVLRTCGPAQASRLLVGGHADAKVAWKWTGESTGLGEFGTPTDTTAYTLCVFAGSANALVAEADVPPDAQKWRARGSQGFTYKDPTGAADGIRKIMLAGSSGNNSKVSMQGHGGALAVVAPPFSTPVTAQLTNSSTNVCWSATYDAADVKRNTTGVFHAKAKVP